MFNLGKIYKNMEELTNELRNNVDELKKQKEDILKTFVLIGILDKDGNFRDVYKPLNILFTKN